MEKLSAGVELIRKGKLIDAEAYFNQQLTVEPDHEGMLRFLGKTQFLLNKKKEALLTIEKVITLKPAQPMWLYKHFAELKLSFKYVDSCVNFNHQAKKILSCPVKLNSYLDLDKVDYPLSILDGDGCLGKKIMYKAIIDKRVTFVSPFDGSIVSSRKSISEYCFWFEEGFYLTFYSDWAYPFLCYQIYVPAENNVYYGYLDKSSELASYDARPDSFLMYYANLLRVTSLYTNEINKYLEDNNSSDTLVRVQNYKHLGHTIWNGLSALSPFIDDSRWKDKAAFFSYDIGVLGLYAASALEKKLPRYKKHEVDIELDVYKNNLFMLTLKDNHISQAVADIVNVKKDSNAFDKAYKFKCKYDFVVLLGLRVGTRQCLNQEEIYVKLIQELSCKYPEVGFVIDGMNLLESEVHSSHASIDLQAEIDLANRICNKNKNVVSVVGTTLENNLPWINISDFCVAPWGAGLAKYKWICNKKTIVFSSKAVLEEKNDKHIYESEKYRQRAAADSWLNSQYSNNDLYNSFQEFRTQNGSKIHYYYQDYSCDSDAIISLVLKEMHNKINWCRS